MTASPIARRYDLDWIRIGAFALLILYHVGMYYVPWDWHLKSPQTHDWLQPFMVLTNPWRITLLFVISGAASHALMSRTFAAAFAWSRLKRLVPPILFGMLVIVPPQTWLQLADLHGGLMDPGRFYSGYLAGSLDVAGLSTPTWNHLWFVVYLLTYSLALAVVASVAPRLPAAAARVVENRPPLLTAFILPVVWFSAVHLVVRPRQPETYAFVGDWTVHLQGAAAFAFGYMMIGSARITDFLERRRRPALVIACAAGALYVGSLCGWIAGRIDPVTAETTMQWVHGLDQWAFVCAILGYGRRWLRDRDGPVRRYLSEAVFPLYIVHQTLIIAIAWGLRPVALHDPLEAAVISVATFALGFLVFEGVRRLRWFRPLLGLAVKPGPPGVRPTGT